MDFERASKVNFIPRDLLITRVDFRRARLPSSSSSDYDPHAHRKTIAGIGKYMAYLHLLRTMLGPGVLLMPLAISQTGLVVGPLMVLVLGALLIHTHLMLLHNLTEICRRMRVPYMSYRYGFRLAVLHGPPIFHFIGKRGPELISTFMFLSQLGICVVYVIFSANCLRDIVDFQLRQPAVASLLIPFIVVSTLMKNLQAVSYFSVLGNILNIIGFIMIISFSFCNVNVSSRIYAYPRTVRNMFWATGTYMFNLSVLAVVLALDKGIKDPKVMSARYGVVTVGITIALTTATCFGCILYWIYGSMDENILQVIPIDDNFSSFVNFLYLWSMTIAYPTQCYPAISVIIEVIKHHDPYAVPTAETLHRIRTYGQPLFVAVTFLITYHAPYSGAFVPFVGNLCTSLLAIVCPALMDLCIRYPKNYGRCWFHLIKNLFVMCFGLMVWILGIYYCWQYLYVNVIKRQARQDIDFV